MATEKFKEIQNAYAVLSDPQERAWYDQHREAILQGSGPSEEAGGAVEEEPGVSLWAFFSAGCYRGFGADSGGFYRVCALRFVKLLDLRPSADLLGQPSLEPSSTA